jgi:hypothetical protein
MGNCLHANTNKKYPGEIYKAANKKLDMENPVNKVPCLFKLNNGTFMPSIGLGTEKF